MTKENAEEKVIEKVGDLLPEVTQEIRSEREKKVKQLLRTKKQEIDAARKMLKAMEEQYQKLLDTKIDEFLFPHELDQRCLSSDGGRVIGMRLY